MTCLFKIPRHHDWFSSVYCTEACDCLQPQGILCRNTAGAVHLYITKFRVNPAPVPNLPMSQLSSASSQNNQMVDPESVMKRPPPQTTSWRGDKPLPRVNRTPWFPVAGGLHCHRRAICSRNSPACWTDLRQVSR